MKLLRIILLNFSLVVLASCAKNLSGPSPEDSQESTDVIVQDCNHSGLVHHPAVTATARTRGNVEYWSCPECGKRFSDAEGKQEYTGKIYTLPTKFINTSCLAGYDPFFRSAGTKGVGIAGTIVTISEMMVSIGSLITTCLTYCDDCEKTVQQINEVTAKESKSAADLEYLDGCLFEISHSVKEYCKQMDTMQLKVDAMIDEIDEANEILKNTSETLVKSLESAAQVENRIRLHNLFDTRYKEVTNLEVSTSCAWAAIQELMHKGMDLLPSAGTALDSADVFISKIHQIEAVISAWGSDWSYPSETAGLLERYNRMDSDYGSTYISLLDDYCTDHFVWEHQAIAFKMMMMNYDFTVLSQAFALSMAYYRMSPDLEEVYSSHMIASMTEDYNNMTDLAASKTEEYEKIYTDSDRVCNVTGKTFSIYAKEIDPKTFLLSVATQFGDILYDSINLLFWGIYGLADTKEETAEKAVDDYDLELFCTGSQYISLWDICFRSDAGGMGFKKSFESDMPAAIMVPFGDNECRLNLVSWTMYPHSETVEVWSNCRIDKMQPKEIYLGKYTGTFTTYSTASCDASPEAYRYFTFEVTSREEDGE